MQTDLRDDKSVRREMRRVQRVFVFVVMPQYAASGQNGTLPLLSVYEKRRKNNLQEYYWRLMPCERSLNTNVRIHLT